MTEEDRVRWEAGHQAGRDPEEPDSAVPPAVFAPYADLFPQTGVALDLACGEGGSAVWLATRGLEVCGVDISSVAIERARRRAARHDVGGRCRWQVADLDEGLPPGPPAAVVLCHMFRDERLYRPMADRLRDGGLLAIAVLSEVGDRPGPFRARAGELRAAFADLSVIAGDEGAGRAWLLARR